MSRVRIDIITIFPDYFTPLSVSLLGKAASRGDVDLQVHDLRTWAHGVHRAVDDAPFGGGPGMVMSPEPWGEALDAVTGRGPSPARLVVPTPAGGPFTQAMAADWARCGSLVFACGRYEGIDARVVDDARERMPVDEVSIGDYVLSGGEPAVLVMVDAVGRLLPGVLGNADSAADDSFGAGEGPRSCCPAITRPSPAGGAIRRCAGPPRCARIWLPACSPAKPEHSSTPGTARCSLRLASRSVLKIWHTEVCRPHQADPAGARPGALSAQEDDDHRRDDATRSLACARVRTTRNRSHAHRHRRAGAGPDPL